MPSAQKQQSGIRIAANEDENSELEACRWANGGLPDPPPHLSPLEDAYMGFNLFLKIDREKERENRLCDFKLKVFC